MSSNTDTVQSQTSPSYIESLSGRLKISLLEQGLSDQQAQKIADEAQRISKSRKSVSALFIQSIGFRLSPSETPEGREVSGFVEGAVSALDEAGVFENPKVKTALGTIVEVVQKSLADRKTELGIGLLEYPAIIANASVIGMVSSGVPAEDVGDSLKVVMKEIVESLPDTGLPADKISQAAGSALEAAVASLDSFEMDTSKIGDVSAQLLAGAIDGISSNVSGDEVGSILKTLATSVVDGFKEAGVSDAELATEMRKVSKSGNESIANIGIDQSQWADLSGMISEGMVTGLASAGVAEDFLDDVVHSIAQGSVEGTAVLSAQLSDEQMQEMIESVSKGASKALSGLGLSNSSVVALTSVLADGASAGLAALTLPESIKNDLKSAISDGTTSGLASSGLSQSELVTIAQQVRTQVAQSNSSSAQTSETSNSTPTPTPTPTPAESSVVSANGSQSGANQGSQQTQSGSSIPPPLAEGASITLSGRFNLALVSPLLNPFGSSINLSALSVECTAFSNPPVSGTGTIGSDGAFSVVISGAQLAVGCQVFSGDQFAASFVFKNTDKKSIEGATKTDHRVAFANNANLGEVNLNLATAKAEVDVSLIQTTWKDTSTANSSANAFDFSGRYTIDSVNFSLPKGYGTSCAPGPNCFAPPTGMELWLKRVSGKTLSDDKPAYGLMGWNSEASFNSCGTRLGASYDNIATIAGIDFSQSGINEGIQTWPAGWVDGWKSSTALVTTPLKKVERAAVNGYPGTKEWFFQYRTCTDSECTSTNLTSESGYVFNVVNDETGCRRNGSPYVLNDMGGMTCSAIDLSGGLKRNTCSKVVESDTVTCVSINGLFRADGNSIADTLSGTNQNPYVMESDYVVYGTPGQLCSAIAPTDTSEAAEMARLRCHANNYFQLAFPAIEAGQCLRAPKFDWLANTPTQFLIPQVPQKTLSQSFFERFEYDSPESGSFRFETRTLNLQSSGAFAMGPSLFECETAEAYSVSLRRVANAQDLIMEISIDSRNITSSIYCAAFSGLPQNGLHSRVLVKLIKN